MRPATFPCLRSNPVSLFACPIPALYSSVSSATSYSVRSRASSHSTGSFDREAAPGLPTNHNLHRTLASLRQ